MHIASAVIFNLDLETPFNLFLVELVKTRRIMDLRFARAKFFNLSSD